MPGNDQTNHDAPPVDKPVAETLTVPPRDPATAPTVGLDSAAGSSGPALRSLGDYELLEEIARGGMGVVYKARQVSLNRVVAIKMILSGRLASESDVQRFRQEAEAAAGLDHANILPIHEVRADDGHHYFSMKLVEGGNLTARVRDLVAGPRAAASLVERIARAVHYAHQRGILHRDLKPGNVLIDGDGTPYVTDFGLAKKVEGDSTLTQSGAVVGTPSYMAPEQARGAKGITTAADVYSLGAILYELLTGRPPFKGESVAQTLRMVEEQDPTRPRWLNPACDPDLEAVALKCLEKDPGRRYETAGAMADDLQRWLNGEPVTARRAGPGRRAWKWVRRNPVMAGLVTACVGLLAFGIVSTIVYAVQSHDLVNQVLQNEARAKANETEANKNAAAARQAADEAKVRWYRGMYEQMRTARLARAAGSRNEVLKLAAEAARLRGQVEAMDPRPADIPTAAELRTEVVSAFLRPDARLVREIAMPMIMNAHFSSDGRRMAHMFFEPGAGDKSGMRFVDLDNGTELGRALIESGPDSDNFALIGINAMNRDGTRAVVIVPGIALSIQVREIPSGKLVTDFGERKYPHFRARISPDGSKVAATRTVGEEAQLVVWDVARPTVPRVLARLAKAKQADVFNLVNLFGTDGPFAAVRFTPDSKRVSFAVPDRTAYRVIDLAADGPAAAVELPITEKFVSAEWHPTEPLLAVVETTQLKRQRVVLWDVDRKAVRAACGEDRDATQEFGPARLPVAFSHDGQWLAVGGADPVVHVYRTLDGAEWLRIDVASAVGLGVSALFWNARNQLVTGGVLEGLKVWELERPTGSEVIPQIKPEGRPAFSPDGRWLAVFSPSGKPSAQSERALLGAVPEPANDRVALIDRRTRRVVRFLPGQQSAQGRIFFAPDGQRLVLENKDEIVVRAVDSGDEVLRRGIDKNANLSEWRGSFFGPGGQLLAFAQVHARKDKGSKDNVVLWDPAVGRQVPGFPVFGLHEFHRQESVVATDGSRLLLVRSPVESMMLKKQKEATSIRLFDIPSGSPAGELQIHSAAEPYMVAPARFGSGGQRLLAVQAPLAMILGGKTNFADFVWTVRELPSGEQLLRIPVRTVAEQANDFGPGARTMALGVDRGYVEYWDVDAKELLFRWQPHGGKPVTQLSIGPEGDIATVAQGDDALAILRLNDVRAKLTELGLGW
ncbi:MAG TPA: WD40 repeat domain-containing serine/threonine protein kinase [Gemmataceae bacterium]|nr:WD40 repeat domain-containing serine/threonine protein kinase [Gemmataceae bacterium]